MNLIIKKNISGVTKICPSPPWSPDSPPYRPALPYPQHSPSDLCPSPQTLESGTCPKLQDVTRKLPKENNLNI